MTFLWLDPGDPDPELVCRNELCRAENERGKRPVVTLKRISHSQKGD